MHAVPGAQWAGMDWAGREKRERESARKCEGKGEEREGCNDTRIHTHARKNKHTHTYPQTHRRGEERGKITSDGGRTTVSYSQFNSQATHPSRGSFQVLFFIFYFLG